MKILFILLLLNSVCYAQEVKKDRYNEALLRQDSEVLTASSDHESTYYVAKKEDSVIELQEAKSDITVKTQWCDENSCSEWKDNNGE